MKKLCRASQIRLDRKASLLRRQLSELFFALCDAEPDFSQLFITRVELSKDGGICTIFFSTYTTRDAFEELFDKLVCYRPSLRSSLAKMIDARYTPDLFFRYDDAKEKERRVTELLTKLDFSREAETTP
ncbi:ribosome-binding factor A [bacterium]|jgi:ribosome-binding factor A|nr:ribosome-binding factor A [bacterium]